MQCYGRQRDCLRTGMDLRGLRHPYQSSTDSPREQATYAASPGPGIEREQVLQQFGAAANGCDLREREKLSLSCGRL